MSILYASDVNKGKFVYNFAEISFTRLLQKAAILLILKLMVIFIKYETMYALQKAAGLFTFQCDFTFFVESCSLAIHHR